MHRDMRSVEEKIAERNAKLDALHENLTAAVESLVTGDDWIRAMTFAARFRSRSFNNTLLIWMAHSGAYENGRVPEPMPTYVAGFQQWQQLERHVIKGQSGYQILAPVTARMASREPASAVSWRRLGRYEKPDPGEVVRSRMIGAKPAYVWDVSQTDGKPVPELPTPKLLTGQAPAGLWARLAQILVERGFTLHDAPDAAAISGANGMTRWSERTVHVRVDMDDASRCRTLAHELGHIVLHDDDHQSAAQHRDIAEVEAESFALMITAAHNMDASQYTIPYVSTWASSRPGQDPVHTVQSTAVRVRQATISVLGRLDTIQTPDGTPPGLDLTRSHSRVSPATEHLSALDRIDSSLAGVDRGGFALDALPWCGKEAAHVLLHAEEDHAEYVEHRGIKETEAESVAYVVAGILGIDTSAYSVGYVAGWSQCDAGTIKATAANVRRAAHILADALTEQPKAADLAA